MNSSDKGELERLLKAREEILRPLAEKAKVPLENLFDNYEARQDAVIKVFRQALQKAEPPKK